MRSTDEAAPGAIEGEVLDEKYRIEQLLGEGRMGAVYPTQRRDDV